MFFNVLAGVAIALIVCLFLCRNKFCTTKWPSFHRWSKWRRSDEDYAGVKTEVQYCEKCGKFRYRERMNDERTRTTGHDN